MVSAKPMVGLYEIWLDDGKGYREPVQACGFFRTRASAELAAGRLMNWVWNGVYSDALPYPLLALPGELASMGIDPDAVKVGVVERVPGLTDNQVSLSGGVPCRA